MNIQEALWQLGFPLLGRLDDIFDLSLDTWFKLAAIVILWVYMLIDPGQKRERVEY